VEYSDTIFETRDIHYITCTFSYHTFYYGVGISLLYFAARYSRKEGWMKNRYKVLFDNAADAIFIHNLDGVILEVNETACEWLGYSRSALLRMSLRDVYTPECAVIISERIQNNYGSGRFMIEADLVKHDGRIVPVALNICRIRFDNNPVFVFSVRDISDREKVKTMFIEMEKRFMDLLENFPSPVYLKDTQNRYFMVNQQFRSIIDKRNDQIVGKTDHDLFPHDNAVEFVKHDRQVMESGCRLEFEETVHQGNTVRRYISIKFPLIKPSGELEGICGISTEITWRKYPETQFLHSQRIENIARLAGGLVHDFNNILTVINGYTDIALLKLAPDNSLYGDIIEIRKACILAGSFTRQLLTFSRCKSFESRGINVHVILEDMNNMLLRLIGKNIELIVIKCCDGWPVKMDPGQLWHIITNLVVNSRDAMPAGGKLVIRTDNISVADDITRHQPEIKPGDYFMITVTDTGEGMDDEVRSKIFEPFFTTKEKGEGTGLGLSTCYGILKQIGGYIYAESQPKKGTTFTIYLPRYQGES